MEFEAMFCELFPCGLVQIIYKMEEFLSPLTEGSENPFSMGSVCESLNRGSGGTGDLKVVDKCFCYIVGMGLVCVALR